MESSLPSAQLTALLGRGTEFEGKLYFEGRIRLDGKFRGQILGQEVLVIGEGADIEADIEVGTLIMKGGRLSGTVRAAKSIELYLPSEVEGSLLSPEIHMDKGVRLAGTCQIGPVNPPTESDPAPL